MYSCFNVIHIQQMEVVVTDHRMPTSGLAANEDAHIQDVSSGVTDESWLAHDDSDLTDDDDDDHDCDVEGTGCMCCTSLLCRSLIVIVI